MRIRAGVELLILRRHRRFPSSSLVIQEVDHRRRAGIMIVIAAWWHRMRHEMYRLWCIHLRRQNLYVQWCFTRGTAVIIRLTTVAHGVPVDTRVSGHQFHLHEADGTEALGLEALVEIRIQRVHDLSVKAVI